ncbi:MAG: hypothetical protein IJG87_03685 [Ruminococcus sp.]|nr:hypothetical protein [Ruminococcus sp.]
MNTLLLDIHDESVIEGIRELNKTEMTFGTIDDLNLIHLPDLIYVDFDSIIGSNKREEALIAMAREVHPYGIAIVALAKEWHEGMKDHALRFGADECLRYDQLATIRTIVHIYERSIRLYNEQS